MTARMPIDDSVPPRRKKLIEVVSEILGALNRRRGDQGVTIAKLMKEAGLGASTWDSWQSGRNSPGLEEIDRCARVLGARVTVIDAETQRELPPAAPFGTPQSVEISGLIDALEEEHRETIRETVYRMAKHFADIQARKR